jgi:hypothetical protein
MRWFLPLLSLMAILSPGVSLADDETALFNGQGRPEQQQWNVHRRVSSRPQTFRNWLDKGW